MVKAELTIELNGDDLRLDLNLLKREDWTETEWALANTVQEILLTSLEIVVETTKAKLVKQEIIKDKK